jgi:hypothetical protein
MRWTGAILIGFRANTRLKLPTAWQGKREHMKSALAALG